MRVDARSKKLDSRVESRVLIDLTLYSCFSFVLNLLKCLVALDCELFQKFETLEKLITAKEHNISHC
jgi:hypothetical protein